MVARAVIEGYEVKVARLKFSAASTILLALAAAFAALAVSANVGVTALHPETWGGIWVFGWLYAIVPPLSLLGLAWIMEKIVLSIISEREVKRRAFAVATEQWEKPHADIERHLDYLVALAVQILDQLTRVSKKNRETIEAAVEDDPAVRGEIIRAELARHNWALLETASGALTAGVHGSTTANPSTTMQVEAPVESVADRVAALWNEDPSTRTLSSRAIAQRVNASHTAVNNAVKLLRTSESSVAVEVK